jgi:hypothetical protein
MALINAAQLAVERRDVPRAKKQQQGILGVSIKNKNAPIEKLRRLSMICLSSNFSKTNWSPFNLDRLEINQGGDLSQLGS